MGERRVVTSARGLWRREDERPGGYEGLAMVVLAEWALDRGDPLVYDDDFRFWGEIASERPAWLFRVLQERRSAA